MRVDINKDPTVLGACTGVFTLVVMTFVPIWTVWSTGALCRTGRQGMFWSVLQRLPAELELNEVTEVVEMNASNLFAAAVVYGVSWAVGVGIYWLSKRNLKKQASA